MAAKSKTTKSPFKTKKGKRYSDEERREIIAFVESTNAERGRGGVTAAAARFNVSPLSIGNWIRMGAGGDAPDRPKGRPGRKPKSASGDVLSQLVSLKAEIDQHEKDAAAKRATFDQLKRQL